MALSPIGQKVYQNQNTERLMSVRPKTDTQPLDVSLKFPRPQGALPGATISTTPPEMQRRAPIVNIAKAILPKAAFENVDRNLFQKFSEIGKFLAPTFSDQMKTALEETPGATTQQLEERARELDAKSGIARVSPTLSIDPFGAVGSVRRKGISAIDKLIAENRARVVSRNGKDVYQIKAGQVWKTVRDEASAVKQLAGENEMPLLKRKLNLDFEKDIPFETAKRAHEGTSFYPERRAEARISDYSSTMKERYEELKKFADTPEKEKLLDDEFARFRDGYKKRTLDILGSEARTISPMISGPANFPVARNRKILDSIHNKYTQLSEFEEKAMRSIKNKLNPTQFVGTERKTIDAMSSKLEEMKQTQAKMKEANKIIKKGIDVDNNLKNLGYSDDTIKTLLEGDFLGRKGWPSYSLTSVNNKIKTLEKRVAITSRKRELADTVGTIEKNVGDAKVVKNFDADRLQLFFDGKPTDEVRALLKSKGFRWSPSAGAWQRKLTTQAERDAVKILGEKEVTKTPVLAKPIDTLSGGSLFGQKIQPEKRASQLADIKKGENYNFTFKVGDKVQTSKGPVIVGDRYIENGQARYVVYPPGKKTSYGYHTWVHEKDITFRGGKAATVKINNASPYTKEMVQKLANANLDSKPLGRLLYGLRNFDGDVSKILSEKEMRLIDKYRKKPLLSKPTKQLPQALEEKKIQLEIAQEALDNNPAKQLQKYTAKTGQNKGVLQEVTGGNKGKFAKTGDDIVTELGFEDSEQAREAVLQYQKQKEVVSQLKQEIAEETKALRVTPTTPAKPKATPIPKSSAEARSLEEAAQQALNKVDEPIRPKVPSLQQTIEIPPTPVKQKINALDYIRTPNRVLEKIGLGKEAALLRKQYDKYVIELPKNIDKITAWHKRVPKASSQRLFDYLDGKDIKLSPEERRVANEMREYLKEWADRLKLPEDNRVTHYITHLFDDQLIQKEFDEDLAKIIGDKIPGEVYDPFLLKRLGAKGYKRDVWKALDAYTKRATRKVHMDPALEKLQDKAGHQLEFSRLEESQFKYVKNYIDRVQMRPTDIDNLIDNTVKQVIGYRFGQRPVTFVTKFLRQMTYRGMLGGNIGSAMRNLSQGINNYAVLGEKYTALGYIKLLRPGAKKELAEQGVFASNFIEDRALSSTKKALQKIDRALWFFFDQAEKINRGAAYYGAKAKAINAGKTEEQAIDYAKSIIRKTQFAYDAVDQPVVMGSDITKTLFQFQTFTTKQTEFLLEMVKDKNFVGLLRYAIAGYAFVNTIGKAMGMEEKELLPLYRFDTPPSLKFPVELGKAAVDAPDKYGNQRDWKRKASDIGKAALGIIPGGIQMRKTYQGVTAAQEGGSYTKSGYKQFDVGGTTAKDIQAGLFGKYAGKEAKDYYAGVKTPEQELKAKKAEESAEARAKIQPVFDNVQELVANGKTDEAQKVVDALSDEEYETYKKIRSSYRAKNTEQFRLKLELDPAQAVSYLRSLPQPEAERILNLMSDEEYARYELGKTQ